MRDNGYFSTLFGTPSQIMRHKEIVFFYFSIPANISIEGLKTSEDEIQLNYEPSFQKEVFMTTIVLDQNEVRLIHQVLNSTLEDLRSEIHHTDKLEYKEELKVQEQVLHELITKLQPLVTAEALKIEMT
jgi:hypothetical protein